MRSLLLGTGLVTDAALSLPAVLCSARYFWRRSADPTASPQIQPRQVNRHYSGREWTDEYSWLEAGGPEVQQVLAEERRHAQRWLRRCAATAERLHAEMLAAVPAEQLSVPERVGGHEYYVEQLPSAPHPRYMRRPVSTAAARSSSTRSSVDVPPHLQAGSTEAVLDVNELAAVHGEYVQVGQMKLSRCGRRVAFTLEAGDGEESFQAFTRDLTTGALRHLAVLGGVVSLEWAADGRTLLATQPNELGRAWRVVACDTGSDGDGSGGRRSSWHTGGRWLGSGNGAPSGGRGCWLVFEEGDERFFVELGRTKDWRFLTINCNSKASSEVHLLPAELPTGRWWGGCGSTGTAAPSATSALGLQPRVVQERLAGLEYFVEHNAGQLYILSNAGGAGNYAVYSVPADAPHLGHPHWQLVVPEQPGVAIEDMDMTRDWLVLYQRAQGRQQVAALLLRGGLPAGEPGLQAEAAGSSPEGAAVPAAIGAAQVDVGVAAGTEAPPPASGQFHESVQAQACPRLRVAPLPSWALSVVAGANADFDSSTLRLMLSSPVHPEATFDWEVGSQSMVWRAGGPSQLPHDAAQQPANHGSSRSSSRSGGRGDAPQWAANDAGDSPSGDLVWQQLWATSADGNAVPMTVAHTTDLLPGTTASSEEGSSVGSTELAMHLSPRPCLLVVYGAYGHCLPTEFLPERLPLLRAGWVLALAHVRGGGELGRRWHAAGQGAAKGAGVADLEACLEALVAAGYTRPGLVALEAHSAGGVAAGALLNRRPADVGAALLEAPFVDVLSAMCQPDLPLTVHEYDEWGDPRQAEQLEQIRRVCPYQNVQPAAPYPPMLLTCSQQDLRVPFWGPLKHAARLRASVAAAAAAGCTRAASGGSGSNNRGSGGGSGSNNRGSGGGSGATAGGPILLLPDEQAGHFVHERDRYTTKAQQYAFLAAAIEGRLQAGNGGGAAQ